MSNKKSDKNIIKTKYFKWGLTAFLVIIASMLSIYVIFNGIQLKSNIDNLFGMLMPIIDGFVVAYLLRSLVNWQEHKLIYPFLKKKKVEITNKIKNIVRTTSITLSMLLVIALIILFINSVIPQIIDSIQTIFSQMSTYRDNLVVYINGILINLNIFEENDVYDLVDTYYEDIMQFVTDNIIPSVNDMKLMVASLYSSISVVFGALFDLLVGFFIAIYLLFSKEKFKGQTKKLIYSFFRRERANLIIADIRYIDKTFGSFVVGKIIDSIIIGCLCFIVTTLCSMPYPLLVSVIIGVTNVIPFFGPFLGAIPSALLILLIDPMKALYFIIIVLILQQFDGNVLGPLILGNSTGLSGFWVIFSITLFGGLFGVPGMFLGVPTFACIYAWIRRKMRMNLSEKNLVYETEAYIDLKYISEDNEIITNEQAKELSAKDLNIIDDKDSEVHFISLDDSKDPVSLSKQKKIRNIMSSICVFIKKLFADKGNVDLPERIDESSQNTNIETVDMNTTHDEDADD